MMLKFLKIEIKKYVHYLDEFCYNIKLKTDQIKFIRNKTISQQ